MPVKYIVVDNGNLVIERWEGKISHAELVEHERRHFQDSSIKRRARVLVDARDASFPETTADGFREVTELYAKLQNRASAGKCALLVSPVGWQKAKAFETGGEKYGVTIITFNELGTACSWLGIDRRIAMDHLKNLAADKPDAGKE
jgi:hypothetical protein